MMMSKEKMSEVWFAAFLDAHKEERPFDFTTRQFVAWVIETYGNPHHVGGVSSYSKFIAHYPGIVRTPVHTRQGHVWRYGHVDQD